LFNPEALGAQERAEKRVVPRPKIPGTYCAHGEKEDVSKNSKQSVGGIGNSV